MASTPENGSLLLSFFEWTTRNYESNCRPSPNLESIDFMLDFDIANYDTLHLSRCGTQAQIDDFRGLSDRIRSYSYDFEPAPISLGSIWSFAQFKEVYSDSAGNYQGSYIYDQYAAYLSHVGAPQETLDTFDKDREDITEGDRRELYGFSREFDANTSDVIVNLHAQRQIIRQAMAWTDIYDPIIVAEPVAELLLPIVNTIRTHIAREVALTEAQREEMMERARQAALIIGTHCPLHPRQRHGYAVTEDNYPVEPPLEGQEYFQLLHELDAYAESIRLRYMPMQEVLEEFWADELQIAASTPY